MGLDRCEMTSGISNDCGQEFDQDRLRGRMSRGRSRHKVPHMLVIGNAIKHAIFSPEFELLLLDPGEA